MSIEENKAIVHRFIDGLGRGDLSVMDRWFADSFANYRTDGKVMDRSGYKQMCSFILKGSSDVKTKIDEILAEGERLAFRFTISWTDNAGFMGKPPSGKAISMSEAYFVGFADGKIAEFINFQAQPRRE